MSTTRIYGAIARRQAEIVAEANHMKATSGYAVSDVRKAERDALEELADGDYDSVEAVEAVEGVSARVLEYDSGNEPGAEDDADDGSDADSVDVDDSAE